MSFASTNLRPLMLALCLAWLTGCSGALTRAGLGPPYQPISEVRADELMPLAVLNREPGVVRVSGNDGEEEKPDSSEAIAPDTWRMRVADYWVVDVVRGQGGAVSALSETDLHEGQRVAYVDPLPMLPETLRFGEPLQSATQIHVYNHGSDALLTSGQCKQTITLLGTRPINTPRGKATATLIQTRRQYKFPLVRVDIDILTAYVPGRGHVAAINRRVIRFLGLVPITLEQHVTRIE